MEKSTYIGIGIFLVLVIGGLLLFSEDKDIREISIDAKWFEFNPNEIRVNAGEEVIIKIDNLDVNHGINIPQLGISGNNELRFKANKRGEFDFYCNTFCGEGHRDMVGKLIIE